MLNIFLQIVVTIGGLLILGYILSLHSKQQYRLGVENTYDALRAGLRTNLSASDKSEIYDLINQEKWPSPNSVEGIYIQIGRIHRAAIERNQK